MFTALYFQILPVTVANHFITHNQSNVYKLTNHECGAAGDRIRTVIVFEPNTNLLLMPILRQFVISIAIVRSTF